MTSQRHWSQMQDWSLDWGMRLLFAVYRRCGRRMLQVFLYPVVSYYWLANAEARRASRDYLARLAAFEPDLKLSACLFHSYRHFLNFANAIIDKLAAWSGLIDINDVEFVGREQLLADLGAGRGALLLASHLGNPEVCRVMADRDAAVKITVLVHTKHAAKFNRLLRLYNPGSAMNLLQVTEINAATAMLLAEKIEQGELVVIAADRTPVNGGRTLSVDFLGAAAKLPIGPFVLAGLLKCPVYYLFCIKQDNRHRIVFERAGDALSWRREQRDAAVRQAASQYAQRLQTYTVSAPLQWFNFYDFWQT
ncbi:hypothetical protein [Methylomonas koyamae]|uniref:Uncharacterized protein n=1 Tax=Methylomonas koyamae TaxID=702114 RepID=A0A291IN34_9GAMM|nr:hypothetical protein [Methylomonas koyamae]ATG91600.1 Lipid A biosynthesis acyltransferase [Methylomonas koyamae]OAI28119.1 hypothetical protein A1356_07515 [Methylomonas koyamae]